MADITASPSASSASTELMHKGCNIGFDALEANRALNRVEDSVTAREAAVPVDLVWRDLTFDELAPTTTSTGREPTPIKQGLKRVLHGLSGQVRTGQVLAIMGASGSGKTTLLNLLSGRMKSSTKCVSGGKIFVNGHSRDYETFPQIAKFVEQDDTTMFAELTVREQILFAARLALPSSVSETQKVARVDKIIQELGLTKAKDTYVGSELVRGVSGGERRRAAIGVELVTDPSLIFLDEPTTGLDSFNALNVMSSLRQLAKNGRTIVTTIHQPRSSIFHLFDMLCLIAEGRTVYFGPAADVADYFGNLGFPMPVSFNVADFAIDVLSIDPRTKEKEVKSNARVQYISDHYHESVEPQVLAQAHDFNESDSLGKFAGSKRKNSSFKEFCILTRRTLLLMSRERQLNTIRLSQTLFFGILLGLIWLDTGRETTADDRRAVQGVIFFIVINQCFDAAFGIIFSFPAEKAIINRERSSGFYRDTSYFVGKQLCELPRAAFFNILMLVLVYFMAGLNPDAGSFFTFTLICILVALCGEGLAQSISVFAGDEQMAAAVVPVAVIFQVLFGGFFIRPDALAGYIKWMRWLSFIYYATNAANQVEFFGRGDGNIDDIIIEQLDSSLSKWTNIAVVAGFVAALKLTYLVTLHLTKPRFDRNL
ncbi:unnamed protein product [Chondrus crispus]|uniref:Probable ATP-dependent transporter ycf16 n=1 Tax=Chondrus crispus TaxID=2769 RepID=R7Q270_CHOCR|nr:unnamed protein product [Chondrus crispus]CDF32154.1 unnamed protein product [Chondrus crispus]|eukprot:XP_005711819.1 unnamed protein product [Chondrus crispus]